MRNWQRTLRLVLLVAAVGLAVAVAVAFRRRPAPAAPEGVAPADPKAVVESASGRRVRVNREHEEVRLEYDTLTSYPDGSTKLRGVRVTTVRAGGRTFVITGREAELGQDEKSVAVSGDVLVTASDGMEIRTGRATYSEDDTIVRAPGPVEFARGRLTGSGQAATFARNVDLLTISGQAVVRLAPERSSGASEMAAGSVAFSRADHTVQLTGGVMMTRSGQQLQADEGTALLSADDQRIERLDLRGQARMTGDPGVAGGVRAMEAREIHLTYAADGETLQRAMLTGDARVRVAGAPGRGDREIQAGALDIALAPDGSTLTALTGRDGVRLAIPADGDGPARTVLARSLDGTGDPGRGLTQTRFTESVEFREAGARAGRSARSEALTLAIEPGFGAIEDARFEQNVRFEEGSLVATAAAARYVPGPGTLGLSAAGPSGAGPRVENGRMTVGASRIDVVLAGPVVEAKGAVKSEFKPLKAGRGETGASGGEAPKMPSMFRRDELVAATAERLVYDTATSTATYTDSVRLWQGDTSIKASAVEVDEKSGDLAASGPVVTSIVLAREGKEGARERVHSTASSDSFAYQEASRRATYVGGARVNGPQGDMSAARIELYLTASGDELERAEAYDDVTLRDQNRESRGQRMSYSGGDERYVLTGAPASITDECARVTTGRTVTFSRKANTVIVDGNEQTRTQSRGSASCP